MRFNNKKVMIYMAIISNIFITIAIYAAASKAFKENVNVSNISVPFNIKQDDRTYTLYGLPYTIDTEKTEGYMNPAYRVSINSYVSKKEFEKEVIFVNNEITDDVLCLAQNIYFEARGETRAGKELVALVTLNRVKSNRWKKTICGVVYQKYQFEWVLRKMFMDFSSKMERKTFIEAIEIAQLAIDGKLKDISNGANHYYNPKGIVGKQPIWPEKMKLVLVEGSHKFYKD